MRSVLAIAAGAAVALSADSARACAECFADGSSGRVFGWLALGVAALVILGLVRRR